MEVAERGVDGEFSVRIISVQLHRMLERRRMKREETIQEYFLTMREMASRGAIDLNALFGYVIDGIDETGNKVILYGAKTVREFKDKLEVYERINKNQPEKATKCTKNRDGSIKYFPRKGSLRERITREKRLIAKGMECVVSIAVRADIQQKTAIKSL